MTPRPKAAGSSGRRGLRDHQGCAAGALSEIPDLSNGGGPAGPQWGQQPGDVVPCRREAQSEIVAERIREQIAGYFLTVHKMRFNVTINVGIAAATISMSGIDALLRGADTAADQFGFRAAQRL